MSIYPLYTVGYIGIHANTFYPAMHNFFSSQGGDLIDTRNTPYSQNPAYRHYALSKEFGSHYVQMGQFFGNVNYKSPELGIKIAQPERVSLLIDQLRKAPQIIMCGCKDHTSCHRTHVARLVEEAMPDKAWIIHLTVTDIARWCDRSKPALQPVPGAQSIASEQQPVDQQPHKPAQMTLF